MWSGAGILSAKPAKDTAEKFHVIEARLFAVTVNCYICGIVNALMNLLLMDLYTINSEKHGFLFFNLKTSLEFS